MSVRGFQLFPGSITLSVKIQQVWRTYGGLIINTGGVCSRKANASYFQYNAATRHRKWSLLMKEPEPGPHLKKIVWIVATYPLPYWSYTQKLCGIWLHITCCLRPPPPPPRFCHPPPKKSGYKALHKSSPKCPPPQGAKMVQIRVGVHITTMRHNAAFQLVQLKNWSS